MLLSLPMGYNHVANTGAVNPILRQQYQQVISSLIYIMIGTRPDISFAVTKMASYAANLAKDHLGHTFQILWYLLSTQNYCLKYERKSGHRLIGYVNAYWAGDPNDRRSTSGYVIKLANSAISWVSCKQPTVTNSTIEAEYVCLHEGAKPLMWYHNMFGELGYKMEPIPACIDNCGATYNAQNPITNKQLRHMDIQYHWVSFTQETHHIHNWQHWKPSRHFCKNPTSHYFPKTY